LVAYSQITSARCDLLGVWPEQTLGIFSNYSRYVYRVVSTKGDGKNELINVLAIVY
jgi:hypothetical protein